MTQEADSTFQKEVAQRPFVIKVLGVGGAGGNVLGQMVASPLNGLDFAALDTDATALAQCAVPSRLVLGGSQSRGLGAGGDQDRGRKAAEENTDAIRSLCEGADIVFVIAGLGGGTGTGAGPVVARVAKDTGALVLSIVMLPFECEGKRRMTQARQGLETLRLASDGVICLPNQKVFQLVDENTLLVEAYKLSNDFVAQGVHGIWRILFQSGLVNVDFADLCALTRGGQSTGTLVVVEASGENRTVDLLQKLQQHPLYEDGQALTRASGILVSIVGGPDLCMKDVNRIMEHVNRMGDDAHIIFGATIDPGLQNRLHVTLVASTKTVATETPTPAETLSETIPSPPEEFSTDTTSTSRNPAAAGTPADEASKETVSDLLDHRGDLKKQSHRMRQEQLPLQIIDRGRFAKSEPNLHAGEDLDVPTYIRRGVPLN